MAHAIAKELSQPTKDILVARRKKSTGD